MATPYQAGPNMGGGAPIGASIDRGAHPGGYRQRPSRPRVHTPRRSGPPKGQPGSIHGIPQQVIADVVFRAQHGMLNPAEHQRLAAALRSIYG